MCFALCREVEAEGIVSTRRLQDNGYLVERCDVTNCLAFELLLQSRIRIWQRRSVVGPLSSSVQL